MKNLIPFFALLVIFSACNKQETLNEEIPQFLSSQNFIPADEMPAELLPKEEEMRAAAEAEGDRNCCNIHSAAYTSGRLEAYIHIGPSADKVIMHHYKAPWQYIGSTIIQNQFSFCLNTTAYTTTNSFAPADYTTYFAMVLNDGTTCGGAHHYQWTKE